MRPMDEVQEHTSPSQHEADLRDLLRRSPVIVGRASEVPEPGRFFTHDETGVALLITREETGRVRALLNVCSHRGTRLVYDTTGSATTFACRYHGWTCDLHGRLGRPGRVGLPPALEQFMGERALGEFPCETRHGYLVRFASDLDELRKDIRANESRHRDVDRTAPAVTLREFGWKARHARQQCK